jgi:hypothetical protein
VLFPGGRLDVIDDEDVDRPLARIELELELLSRRAVKIDGPFGSTFTAFTVEGIGRPPSAAASD